MIPILGAVLGLAGAIAPEIIKIFKDKQDKKHELEILKMQIEMAKIGHQQKLEEIQIVSDAEIEKAVYKYAPVSKPEFTGKWWFDILMLLTYVYNTTVRPTISYMVIGLYIFVKFAQFQILKTAQGLNIYEATVKIWTQDDTMFTFLVITFWLGGRQLLRSMGKIK